MASFYSELIHRVAGKRVEFGVWVGPWRRHVLGRRSDELQAGPAGASDSRLAPLPRPLGLIRMVIPGEMSDRSKKIVMVATSIFCLHLMACSG